MKYLTRKLIFLILFILASLYFLLFFVFHRQASTPTSGTATIYALDILSDDIHKKDQPALVSFIEKETGAKISNDGFSIRENSYTKTYGSSPQNYALRFTANLASVKSSYDLIVYYNDNVFGPVLMECATEQAPGYSCNYAPREYIEGDSGN